MKAEVERRVRNLPCLGETVHHAPHVARALVAHDGERVRRRCTRVDDERLARSARRANMRAKTFALPVEVTRQPVIVEAGLADGDDLRFRGPRNQHVHGRLRGVLVIGMHADGGVQVVVVARECVHERPCVHLHGNAQRMRDAVVAHRLQHLREIVPQLGKVKVTVGIDEHQYLSENGAARPDCFGGSSLAPRCTWYVLSRGSRCGPSFRK